MTQIIASFGLTVIILSSSPIKLAIRGINEEKFIWVIFYKKQPLFLRINLPFESHKLIIFV